MPGISRGKSKTSRWARGRERDSFWRDAKIDGWRSRAAYKLLAIDDSFRILKSGLCVVDLGCAPGGWAQVLAQRCLINANAAVGKTANKTADNNNKSGMVVGVDLSVMDAIDGVAFVRGDFLDIAVVDEVRRIIGSTMDKTAMVDIPAADVVVSDMSPNISGVAVIDQANAAALARAAMDFAAQVLKPGGALVIKCFEGGEFASLRARARREYRKVATFRPPATKTKSREVYVIGRGFCAFGGKKVVE